jgi:hypothetical protein
MLQARILSRDEFLRLLQMKSATLDQRVYKHELTFSLGCTRPAHTGEYLLLDVVAVLLISMLNRLAKVEMKTAAEMVLKHWYGWLVGVAQAEHEMDESLRDQTYFAVGTDFNGKGFAAVGKMKEAVAMLESSGPHERGLYMLPLHLVLRVLRDNARIAKIDLPKFLTPEPDTPEFEKFLESIHEYQRLAGAKFKAKAKAKASKRARSMAE